MLTTILFATLTSTTRLCNDSEALQRALASVSTTSIRADVEFLAADVMAGRETPSPELELAAGYLLNRVQRIGLLPGANHEWFQEYLIERKALSASSRLFLESGGQSLQLVPMEGFLWVSCDQADARIEGPVVCIGDAGRAALAALDDDALRGAWAITDRTPKLLQTTRRRLTKAGAIGLLIIDADPSGDPEDDDVDRIKTRTASRLEFGEYELVGGSSDAVVRESALPILQLSHSAAELLPQVYDPLDFTPGMRPDWRIREERVLQSEPTTVRNLCALLPGTSANHAIEVIVCSAHYDHVGVGKGGIYPGADDNASGTSGLLALAEALTIHGPLDRSVLFVWLSGEEKGLWGSEAFCESVPLEGPARVVMNLNLDMIGRTMPGELYITPSRDHAAFGPLSEIAYSLAGLEGFAELQSQDEFYNASDHYNFASLLDVPAVFLSTGDHPDYHQPTDTPDKLDYAKLARVVRLAVRMVDKLSSMLFTNSIPR